MATSTTYSRSGAIRRVFSTLVNRRQPSLALRIIYLTLGSFFGLLTARVLLWEAHTVSELTVEHYLTIGSMVGAITAGLFFWNTLWEGRLLIALGLGLAAVAATTYCLIGSAGRSDELSFERNAAARQVNQDRDRAQRNRDEAKRRYDAALEAETQECSGGAGPRCKGKRATTQDRRSDLEVAELLLQQAKPEQRENGKLKRAAQVIALFTSASEAGAERGLVIVWPFLPPFICELLTIVFLHLGLGHGHKTLPEAKTEGKTVDSSVQFKRYKRAPVKTKVNGGSAAKAMARIDLLGYIETHGAIPNQDFLVDRWRRSKGTVSYWLADWEQAGIIQRQREGKCKVTAKLN